MDHEVPAGGTGGHTGPGPFGGGGHFGTVNPVCGRYVLGRNAEELAERFGVDEPAPDTVTAPGYNVAPTVPVPVVVERETADGHRTRLLRSCRWGLVPSWARDSSGAARMINARVETVATKPAFRTALARRRCLVPADGWYEWAVGSQTGSGRRVPYYLTPRDGSPLAFAGLYEVWGHGPDRLVTCAIITTAATGQLTSVHHRMPLMLAPDRWDGWLDCRSAAPLPADPDSELVAALELRQVGTAVGNVRNQGPQLLAPASPEADQADQADQQALDLR
ncbi:MAG TPA: SOS response-associated peptidase [Mycobacteriales bacterium]|nr:SOS response-associated peptidase [Mycobacteriales bacterium]